MESSNKISRVKDFLTKRKFKFSAVVENPLQEKIFVFFPQGSLRAVVKEGHTSLRQIAYLRAEAKEDFGVDLEFIPTRSADQSEIEEVLQALIRARLPGLSSDCVFSFRSEGKVDIWIEFQPGVTATPQEEIQALGKSLAPHLIPFGVEVNSIQGVQPSTVQPSPVAVLRQLKISQPASPESLLERIESKGMGSPSLPWLMKTLDKLRRERFIIRSKSGQYSLTSAGLIAVPEASRRKSSDIDRILALGKRRWL